MKKLLSSLTLLLLALVLTACGNSDSEATSESDAKNEDAPRGDQVVEEVPSETEDKKQEEKQDTSSAATQSEWMERQENGYEAEISIGAEKTYLWEEESTGIKWLSYYAGVINDGDKAIDVSNASVTFKNEDDGSVITVSTQGIDFSPSVIAPGEIAYVSVYEPAKDLDVSTKVSAELSIDPLPTNGEVQWLDVTNIKGTASETDLKVTAEVTNSSDSKEEDVSTVAGVYDGDEFLGVLEGGLSIGLEPGDTTGAELFTPPFPDEFAKDGLEYEVGAYIIK
jgi:hypothetical protein